MALYYKRTTKISGGRGRFRVAQKIPGVPSEILKMAALIKISIIVNIFLKYIKLCQNLEIPKIMPKS